MDLLDAIGDRLISDGIAEGVSGWRLFKSYMPDTPDNIIAIYEMPGEAPDQTDGIKYAFPAFQVYVRAGEFDYKIARAKIKEVFNSLDDADISGFVYVYSSDSGPVLDMYDKAKNRPVLFWTFRTMMGGEDIVIVSPSALLTIDGSV